MVFNLLKCLKTYKAICELENEKLDFTTAHALVVLKKQLETHAEFYTKKEREIVEKYAIPDKDGSLLSLNGQFKMAAKDTEKFMAEKAELDGIEMEIQVKPIKIESLSAVKPAVLEVLMDVFEFPER